MERPTGAETKMLNMNNIFVTLQPSAVALMAATRPTRPLNWKPALNGIPCTFKIGTITRRHAAVHKMGSIIFGPSILFIHN